MAGTRAGVHNLFVTTVTRGGAEVPRVNLSLSATDVPLTVACVARKVGVSPSTLRTWERRYGLGPSVRTPGAHRRYTALDIARVERMCALMAEGIPAGDAASQALAANEADLGVDVSVDVSVSGLIEALNAHDTVVARSILDRAIALDGLVHAWTRLICPTLARIEATPQVWTAGHAPRVMLRQLVLHAIRRVVTTAGTRVCPLAGADREVIIAVPTESVIAGHVLAAALQWEGIVAGVLSTSPLRLPDAIAAATEGAGVRALLVMDAPREVCEIVSRLGDGDGDLAVYLIGEDVPCVLSARVTRLHTLPAAVAEISGLATHWHRDGEYPHAR